MENVQKRREELYSLLGDLPARDRPITVKTIGQEQRDGFIVEKLLLDLNGIEPVPAFFVKPINASSPCPAVLYNHAHGGDYSLGKDELLKGRRSLQPKPYANELTKMGLAALCIDHWAFGERATRKESEIFKQMLWNGQVMWGMMVYDTLPRSTIWRPATMSIHRASPRSGYPWAARWRIGERRWMNGSRSASTSAV